jgi:hypothetical protein
MKHVLFLAVCAAMSLPTGASAQDNVGVAALVKNQVTGELGSRARTLGRGDGVFRNERVATGQGSALDVLFLDQTSLKLGPNTAIVLDELVFDPSGSQGRVALSVAAGVTRFVSGILPKADYEIRTPSMTIGIRGTWLDLVVRANGDSTVVLRAGEATIGDRLRPQLPAIQLAVAGLAVTAANGQPPGPPGPIPPDVAQALSQLGSAQAAGSERAAAPAVGSPVSARTYTGALSDINKSLGCKSNGSHAPRDMPISGC